MYKKQLDSIKKRFVTTVTEASETLGIKPSEITRNEYIRVSVDTGIEGRLNKEELNVIGGFAKAQQQSFKKEVSAPKVLVLDIETSPIEAFVWSIWDQNIPLSRIRKDWSVLAWAAKWLGDGPEDIVYMDTFNQKDQRDDRKILKVIWKMLDEADIVVGHNSDSFDIKKLNARFIIHGMKPPTGYRKLDTKKLAKRYFGFTSNKLEYITDKLCTKYKKLKHGKFPGNALWDEFLDRNKKAQKEMEIYNKYDVLSQEEALLKILPWDNSINFNVYHDLGINVCTCGSINFKKAGFHYTNTAKFQRYICKDCGKTSKDKTNLLSADKRKSLKR